MSHDLSRYFVVKKFNDGWLMGSQNGPETIFVSRADLIRVGYLPADEPITLDKLAPATKVITIPIGISSDSSDELKDVRNDRPSHFRLDRVSEPINIPKPSSDSDEIIVDATVKEELIQDDPRSIRTMNRLSGPPPSHGTGYRSKRSSYPNRTPNYLDVR